ncbi:MAG TPA: Holliday junction resolvase RuvX [Acidimicrobiales bacterium]|nr:Holliday junction resolvase RuvX [Acidimicrobiales bacterium]
MRGPGGRVVGVDLGSRRVGVAMSDPSGVLASPYEVLERTGDLVRDRQRLKAIVDDAEAVLVVVGLPLSMDGSVGRAASAALEEASALAEVLAPVPVETFDERLTTVSADRSMKERKMDAPARRKVVDQVAAAVMLQAWLDSREARIT